MDIFDWLKNRIDMIGANEEPTNTVSAVSIDDRRLLEFLGIDDENKKPTAEATYFTCLKVLSEAIGKMPLKYYQEDENGGRVRAPTLSKGAELLLNRPNPYMTPSTFWSTVELNCENYGNAYVWIQTKFIKNRKYGGQYEIVGFWPMQSECVEVIMDDIGVFGGEGQLYYRFTDPKSGEEYIYSQENVMHFKTWMTWDGIIGKSVLDMLGDMIEGTKSGQEYLSKLYKSGLTASAILQYTGDINDQLIKTLKDKYTDMLTGVKSAGKVVPVPIGMTLTPLNIKLTDAQFIEIKQYTALQVAAAFGVKPNQLNDYAKSSYANSEMQQLAFLTDTMLFRIKHIEEEINYKIGEIETQEKKKHRFYKFNEKVILRTDTKTQMETLASGIQNAVYTPNEARRNMDLPDKEGGDVLICNGNYVPIEAVGAAYNPSSTGGTSDDS